MDVSGIRKPYNSASEVLLETAMPRKNPHAIFDDWIKLACTTPAINEPNAMTIATVDARGRPTARMVLLKGYGDDGFRFFTNSRSQKGQNIAANPHVALVFYWEALNRSVRVEGRAEKLPAADVDAYYAKRPRPSQIAAHVSERQSAPIGGREVLKERFEALETKYAAVEAIPRPDFWNGYLVKPQRVEFWQGQSTRMHDRIVFSREVEEAEEKGWKSGEDGWCYQRLEP